MTRVRVKICGVRDSAAIETAVRAGADYIGFVFFAPSPRHLGWEEAAALASATPPGVCKVALVVDPDVAMIERLSLLPIDMVQLHGSESPERVAEVRAMLGLPVMKAVGMASAEDLAALRDYEAVSDQILCDAKPPKGATLPGGRGEAFDWTLVAGRPWRKPWMLAGGLTPASVGAAVRGSGALQVDVSSGVESAPGVKDAGLISAFCAAARA